MIIINLIRLWFDRLTTNGLNQRLLKFRTSQSGISLIELIMFIVIVSVALAGILVVMNVTTRNSAAPLVHKQALAIAESLLEEVELMPFTYCDPDDLNAASAVSATVGGGGCNSTVEAMGSEAAFAEQPSAETRYHASTPFDNVNDYDGFSMSGAGGIKDITGTTISSLLDGYAVSVVVAASALPDVAADEALLITVTVTGPDGLPVTVEGMRTRYSPRSLP
ncbi:MAG: type II secretion system protein [Gallionella sp.]